MVETTIRAVDRNVAFKAVSASRGKATRAEPVSALYEQGRVHHCEVPRPRERDDFLRPGFAKKSPDRMDALVWAMTELMVTPARATFVWGGIENYDRELDAARRAIVRGP